MSNRYRDKTCTYCTVPGSSETADHVVALEFFPIDQRDNLPKVPACKPCNGSRSVLEHYATVVMPFGARYPGSPSVLASVMPRRLAKNAPLRTALASGMRNRYLSRDGMNWEQESRCHCTGRGSL